MYGQATLLKGHCLAVKGRRAEGWRRREGWCDCMHRLSRACAADRAAFDLVLELGVGVGAAGARGARRRVALALARRGQPLRRGHVERVAQDVQHAERQLDVLRKVGEATEVMKEELFVTQRCPIDQYARESRIHDI